MTERTKPPIVSAANERYRRLLELATSARERQRAHSAVIEGVHLLEAWFERYGGAGGSVEWFVSKSGLGKVEIAALLARHADAPTVLDDRLFARVSSVEHGAGPLAIVPTPQPRLPAQIDDDAVYLDRIQDPGNVGTILRSCAAVGVIRILASPGTASCWSPKVLRAAMGAHFHLRIHEGVDLHTLRERSALAVRATDATASASLYDTDLRAPGLWLLGNEGQGLDVALREWPVVTRVAIPQSSAVDSLNVGVAAALCLYEQWRQRRAGVSPPNA